MDKPSTDIIIEARKLSKRFQLGGEIIHALQSIDLSVRNREFLAIMGPSGSGKSTLLHLLGLLDDPDDGEVYLAGKRVSGLDDDELTTLRRDKLGFLFQGFELIPNLSARENILLPAQVAGRGGAGADQLEQLSRQLQIQDRLDHRPRELSGGQQQRVALARALINEPEVLLAYEPTGNLDSHTGEGILELLREGADVHGWTVVMVTHDPKTALHADRILFLEDGRVAGETPTRDTAAKAVIESFVGV